MYLGNLLHVSNHLIISLGLFAKPREEGLAVEELAFWADDSSCLGGFERTSHATR
jgi:hypothetical protein